MCVDEFRKMMISFREYLDSRAGKVDGTQTATTWLAPRPLGTTHCNEECERQSVRSHGMPPTVTTAPAVAGPKFTPTTVTTVPDD